MIVFPNAKINIGLNIIEQQADGFHRIESCFYPVPWFDALEVIESKEFSFTTSGITIPGNNNICVEAYKLLNIAFDLPPISIHLHKNIPIGAGLGGGSADGAFMLNLLNDKFSLAIESEKLHEYAGKLGSDCPFFINSVPCFVEGTGERLSSINLDLKGLVIAIVYPQLHISSKSAYHGILPETPTIKLKSILETKPISDWRQQVTNDFEKSTDDIVLKLKEFLYTRGAIYASMSGSGSAVYGLFNELPQLETEHPHIIAQL